MKLVETKIKDLFLLKPAVLEDNRGWFFEAYNKSTLSKLGLDYDFVQDNHSLSVKKNTVRALHLQKPPYAQAKLVRCTRGAIYDIAVDLRAASPTFKQWAGVDLTAQNKNMLLIPRGFAHGFITRAPNSEVCYKVDNFYDRQSEVGIIFDDPELNICWGAKNVILSDKDRLNKPLKACIFT
jgi:dTDP-4-dehydrorhamnose 3,5-epimerase